MVTPPSLLSEVRFGAFLVYSPGSEFTGDVARRSRDLTYGIKQDKPGIIARAVQRLKEELGRTGLGTILGPDVSLVPAPRSAPAREREMLWPSHRICVELVQAGLGLEVLECLTRVTAVPKSAVAGRGNRPLARDHAASMRFDKPLAVPSKITVVDDVVTKGAMLLAAVSLIKAAYPETEAAGFALVRTRGFDEVEQLIEPCVGRIKLYPWGETDRDP